VAEREHGPETKWKLVLLEPESLREITRLDAPGWIDRITFSPDSDRVAIAVNEGLVSVWETGRFRRVAILQADGLPGRPGTEAVGRIGFSPDGRRFLLAAPDGTVRVWDATTWRPIATMRGHGGAVFDVRQSPDGRRVFSAGRDRKVRVWDAKTFELITDLPGHESYVYSLALSEDGETLVSGSGDGTVRIWEARPARERHRAIAERRRLVAELRPVVADLFDRHEEAEKVVAGLKASLTGRRREVALQVALGVAVEHRR
jgi:WD40 repeat protein